jgi:hypothetical protein
MKPKESARKAKDPVFEEAVELYESGFGMTKEQAARAARGRA